MRESFAYIFWGLLLVFLDFSINAFDVLPDGIGYLLVAVGASRLTAQSPQFIAASAISTLLAAAWLVGLFLSADVGWPLNQIVALLNIAMYWTLLGGIMEIAVSRNRADLAERASNRRIAYTIILCLGLFVSYAFQAQLIGRDAWPLVIMLALPGFVIAILILHLIYRVRHELA